LSRGLFPPGAPPPPLPVAMPQQQRQPHEPAIGQGLAYLGLMFVVSGAYFVTVWIAKHVSVFFAPVAFIMIVHAIYLFIYVLERKNVISRGFCGSLIQSAENLCPTAGNFFLRPPSRMVWPRRALATLARYVARA